MTILLLLDTIFSIFDFTFHMVYGHGGYPGIRGYQGLVALASTIGVSDSLLESVGVVWYGMVYIVPYGTNFMVRHGMVWFGMPLSQ